MLFPPELLITRYLGQPGNKLWDKSPDDLVKANPDRVYLFRAHVFLRRKNIWVGDIDFSDPTVIHNLRAFSATIRRNVVIVKIADVMVEKDDSLTITRPFCTVTPKGDILWNTDYALSFKFNEEHAPAYMPECLDEYFGMLRKKASHPVSPVVRTPSYIKKLPFIDWYLLKDPTKDPISKFYSLAAKWLDVDGMTLFADQIVVSSNTARKLNLMFIEWMEVHHKDASKEEVFRLSRAVIKQMQPSVGLWLAIQDNMIYYMGNTGELK